MPSEYILLNLLILAGPLSLSFDRRVYFVQYYKSFVLAIAITMIPFLVWDALVSGSHWWFNPLYTSKLQFFGLPLGEWLFFITVPYACLFTWQVLQVYFKEGTLSAPRYLFWLVLIIILSFAALSWQTAKEYTFLAFSALAISFILEKILKTNLFQRSLFYWLMAALFVMILIFNGYLTARPVVIYDAAFQLDFRIGTIPLEDFIYGYALIIANVTLFERFKRKYNG